MPYIKYLLVFLFFTRGILHAQGKTQKPNIIFILADDLEWGELGCYGNDFNETPHLDKLSRFPKTAARDISCFPSGKTQIPLSTLWPAGSRSAF